MHYYHLNKDLYDAETQPVIVKVSSKMNRIVARMSKLCQQLRKLDKKLIREFASCNNITEDQASDLMADYDFMVDVSQYGCSDFTIDQITKEEYNRLKRINTTHNP